MTTIGLDLTAELFETGRRLAACGALGGPSGRRAGRPRPQGVGPAAHGGLCLVLDRDRLPASAGVLTPATGVGIVLVDRLRSARFTFEIQRRDG
jgi:hypothetical protein